MFLVISNFSHLNENQNKFFQCLSSLPVRSKLMDKIACELLMIDYAMKENIFFLL